MPLSAGWRLREAVQRGDSQLLASMLRVDPSTLGQSESEDLSKGQNTVVHTAVRHGPLSSVLRALCLCLSVCLPVCLSLSLCVSLSLPSLSLPSLSLSLPCLDVAAFLLPLADTVVDRRRATLPRSGHPWAHGGDGKADRGRRPHRHAHR